MIVVEAGHTLTAQDLDASRPIGPTDPTDRAPTFDADEMFARTPDRRRGLVLLSAGAYDFERRVSAAYGTYGADVANATIAQSLMRSGAVRRWYAATGQEEWRCRDVSAPAVTAAHWVDEPAMWPVGFAEAAVLLEQSFVHAVVAPNGLSADNLLLRLASPKLIPCVGFLHSLHDRPAAWLPLYSAPTFACDRLISPSEAGKKALEKIFDRLEQRTGKAPFLGQIEVLPYPVEEHVLPPRLWAKQQLGLRSDAVIILSVGRLETDFKYDPVTVVALFAELRRRRPHCAMQLVVAGSGSLHAAERLQAVCAALGLDADVQIRPNYASETYAQLLAASDVALALFDNVQETYGLSVRECQRAGLAVVAADWSGLREAITHQVDGLLVPVVAAEMSPDAQRAASVSLYDRVHLSQPQHTAADLSAALEQTLALLDDSALRARLGACAAKRAAEQYSQRAFADRLRACMEEACAHAERQPAVGDRGEHLGVHWQDIFGHYATHVVPFAPSSAARSPVRVSQGVHDPAQAGSALWAAVGLQTHARAAAFIRAAFVRAQQPTTFEQICSLAEAQELSDEGKLRWLMMAAKYGWLRVEATTLPT